MKRFLPAAGAVDCHQHLWPPELVERLRARTAPPRLDGWTLHLAGEAPYRVDPALHDPAARLAEDGEDGVGLALLAPSAPLGIEHLEPETAAVLLGAWHGYADRLGPEQALWAAPRLRDPDPASLKTVLDHPAVCGLQVPANAMADPASLERLAPLLAVVEERDLPVLVHPGPAPSGPGPVPGWWPALTSYPAQLAAAWFAWHVAGRALLPRLRIAFVALAGLAPVHHERLAQRGGAMGRLDPDVFYETSSYGPSAVDAVTRVVGADVLVSGSDRPYARPVDAGLGAALRRCVRETNPRRLLQGGCP